MATVTYSGIAERYGYTPYGVMTALTAAGVVKAGGSDLAWTVGHQGLVFVADAGMYANRARWYSPTLMRFASTDPLGYGAGDANVYRYEMDNPATLTDPSGLRWDAQHVVGDVGWGALGGTVGAIGALALIGAPITIPALAAAAVAGGLVGAFFADSNGEAFGLGAFIGAWVGPFAALVGEIGFLPAAAFFGGELFLGPGGSGLLPGRARCPNPPKPGSGRSFLSVENRLSTPPKRLEEELQFATEEECWML